mmetsp:Transcript_88730/g.223405  ORF Transcript_88730/g.223405 Transcript_88730/m.223405 type:complete len:146 (+) Transcript_88730:2008-2445(+)
MRVFLPPQVRPPLVQAWLPQEIESLKQSHRRVTLSKLAAAAKKLRLQAPSSACPLIRCGQIRSGQTETSNKQMARLRPAVQRVHRRPADLDVGGHDRTQAAPGSELLSRQPQRSPWAREEGPLERRARLTCGLGLQFVAQPLLQN